MRKTAVARFAGWRSSARFSQGGVEAGTKLTQLDRANRLHRLFRDRKDPTLQKTSQGAPV